MKVTWKSPANIALVKYWGKYDVQLPCNPSISFTLKHSVTELSIQALVKTNKELTISLDYFFFGIKNFKFHEKIVKFLYTQVDRFPWILTYNLEIQSTNTFPHSSGIASSASSMSALCLSLLSLNELITGHVLEEADFFIQASELSRLASGSASRSVFGGLVSWGQSKVIENSSNLHASAFLEGHTLFNDYCDTILIVDDTEKSISSSAGHGLMTDHPFREQRFVMAESNIDKLVFALKNGDIDVFIQVVEQEALTLHALMMTSSPSYILLRPQSLVIIEKIKNFRSQEKIPVCFTIDAGANIHILYPKKYLTVVRSWIERNFNNELVGKKWIHDEVGDGPLKLEVVE